MISQAKPSHAKSCQQQTKILESSGAGGSSGSGFQAQRAGSRSQAFKSAKFESEAMAQKGKRAAAPAAKAKGKTVASAVKTKIKDKAAVSAALARKLKHIFSMTRPLEVVSHCSGWLSESQALDNLGIAHEVRMASDINPSCKNFITQNFQVEYWLDDMTSTGPSSFPGCDVYTCGFPCQPFSKAGKIVV